MEMEALLTGDNLTVAVLVARVIELKRVQMALEKRLERQWQIIEKVADVLRKIKYVLQHTDKGREIGTIEFPDN